MNIITTDLLIIGGGINGTGIAADAAGRGLSVVLCEQGDLASATSSWSSKLIHGGLRYLETYEFKLVHQALAEREILMKKAPQMIHPLEFILPHDSHLRSRWLIRLGLFLYDHLAKRNTLAASHQLNLSHCLQGQPLKSQFKTGFSYADCQTDDSRLVILNALAAKQHGAKILTHSTCSKVKKTEEHWEITLTNQQNQQQIIHSKVIINAAGPWVRQVIDDLLQIPSSSQVALIQGSHIVIPQLYPGKHAYILQNKDQRIVFAIPYQDEFTLIGTTDRPFSGNLTNPTISSAEIDYLCESINYYFKKTISAKDIVWSYSGVRPLFNDQSTKASKITREFHLERYHQGKLTALSIFGGKLTTYRILAEQALAKLHDIFPNLKPSWTATTPLPGGDFQPLTIEQYQQQLQQKYNWIPQQLLTRYLKQYGTRCEILLENCKKLTDLGQHFGAGLYQKEIDYLKNHEWASSIEDIIWRRTKLGLFLTEQQKQRLQKFL